MKFGVYAGQYFTCSLANGLGYCWGSNVLGALGTGDLASHLVPTVSFGALAPGRTVSSDSAIPHGEPNCAK